MRISDWSSDVCSSDLQPSNSTVRSAADRVPPFESQQYGSAAMIVRNCRIRGQFGEQGCACGEHGGREYRYYYLVSELVEEETEALSAESAADRVAAAQQTQDFHKMLPIIESPRVVLAQTGN